MPLKTCPECSAKSGPRTKTCECGYQFTGATHKKDSHPNVAKKPPDVILTHGSQLWDYPKNFPQPSIPAPLPKGKLSTEDLLDYVRYEGIPECIWGLIPYEKIEDTTLRELWKEAREGIKKVVEYLYD